MLKCSCWCSWGWVGCTDVNHHPCSQQGCCCSPSLEFGLGSWTAAACISPSQEEEKNGWEEETSALQTFQLFLWATAITLSRCNPSLLPLYKFIFLVRKKNMGKIFDGYKPNWGVLNVKNEEGFLQHLTADSEHSHTHKAVEVLNPISCLCLGEIHLLG